MDIEIPGAIALQLRALAPLLVVAGGGLAVMLVDSFVKTLRKGHLAFFTQAILLIAGIVLYTTRPVDGTLFGGMVAQGGYAHFFDYIFLAIGLMTVTYATASFEKDGLYRPEFYPLLLFAIVGMMLLAAATDLMTLYLGLETMSLATYVLVGGRKGSVRASEAGFKYLLLGGFASAVLLMGAALMYGFAGGTSYADIRPLCRGTKRTCCCWRWRAA